MRGQLSACKDEYNLSLNSSHAYGRVPLVTFNPNIYSLQNPKTPCSAMKINTYTPRVNSSLGLGYRQEKSVKPNESFTAGERNVLKVYPLALNKEYAIGATGGGTCRRSKHGASKSTCENPLVAIAEESLHAESLGNRHKRFKSSDIKGVVKAASVPVGDYEAAKCFVGSGMVAAYAFNSNKGVIRYVHI